MLSHARFLQVRNVHIEGYVYQRYVSDTQSARPPAHLSTCLSVRPSVRHSFSPPANQFICFFVSESVSLSMSQSVRHTSVRQSVCLSVSRSVCLFLVCRLSRLCVGYENMTPFSSQFRYLFSAYTGAPHAVRRKVTPSVWVVWEVVTKDTKWSLSGVTGEVTTWK